MLKFRRRETFEVNNELWSALIKHQVVQTKPSSGQRGVEKVKENENKHIFWPKAKINYNQLTAEKYWKISWSYGKKDFGGYLSKDGYHQQNQLINPLFIPSEVSRGAVRNLGAPVRLWHRGPLALMHLTSCISPSP